MDNGHEAVVALDGVTKYFPVTKGLIFSRTVGLVKAVDGVSLVLRRGQTFGLVGESGCGKTTIARIILGLLPPTAGRLAFFGTDYRSLDRQGWVQFRRSVQAVFQDPYSSLNPRLRIRDIVAEPLAAQRMAAQQRTKLVEQALLRVGLDLSSGSLFPHEFSGGQRQRIAVARAIVSEPALVILDEPVSSLDVSVQAQVLNLLADLQDAMHVAFLLVAHNLAIVQHMSAMVAVMYLGKVVEMGAPQKEGIENWRHPYTEALVKAVPKPSITQRGVEAPLQGEVPSPLNPPSGCRFRTRCHLAEQRCTDEEPLLRETEPQHWLACHVR